MIANPQKAGRIARHFGKIYIFYIYMFIWVFLVVRVWFVEVSFVWRKLLPAVCVAVEILMLIVGIGGSNKTFS